MAAKVVRFTGQTSAVTGAVTIQIKVPGTYAGINFLDPAFSGRKPLQFGFFLGTPAGGDACTEIAVKDIDGKIATNLRGQFPNYPTLNSLADSAMPTASQGFYISPLSPFQFFSANAKPIPSEVYIEVTVQKNTSIMDTVYGYIVWDDFS